MGLSLQSYKDKGNQNKWSSHCVIFFRLFCAKLSLQSLLTAGEIQNGEAYLYNTIYCAIGFNISIYGQLRSECQFFKTVLE
jgi:hypothetical protein